MSQTESLHFERTISAPPAEAYRAFTHATALRDWLSNDAISQARPRGFIFLYWNDGYTATCQITQYEPPHSLKLEWYSPQDPRTTQVRVVLWP